MAPWTFGPIDANRDRRTKNTTRRRTCMGTATGTTGSVWRASWRLGFEQCWITEPELAIQSSPNVAAYPRRENTPSFFRQLYPLIKVHIRSSPSKTKIILHSLYLSLPSGLLVLLKSPFFGQNPLGFPLSPLAGCSATFVHRSE